MFLLIQSTRMLHLLTFSARKVFYNIFLDDRAGLRQTYDELIRLYDECIKNKETNY